VAHGHGAKVAIRWIGRDASARDLTFDALRAETNRFANALRSLGVAKGGLALATGDQAASQSRRRVDGELLISVLAEPRALTQLCKVLAPSTSPELPRPRTSWPDALTGFRWLGP
jgi:acyl-CoA synthetase (AMP-forming)/AMP-acid ligase II